MGLGELFGFKKKGISVIAFYGGSGTGKSFRAKLVAQKYHIKAIIDDGLLIYEDQILAGHSAKLEKSYMGAVRVALFDDKEHRDEVARAIQAHKLNRILILGTSEKMVCKIAMRLQLPMPEKFIKIEDIATPEQIDQARISRQIEGKHVIPVRAYEVQSEGSYGRIFVTKVKVSLARKKFFRHFFKNIKDEPSDNTKLFEKSVVKPAFAVTVRKNISQAYLARTAARSLTVLNQNIRLKRLAIKADASGYRLFITVDVPFGEQLTEVSNNIKKSIVSGIESDAGILVEDVSIIVDRILVISA
ncbi:MAG: AAA family ATPase [Treponema sp.]|nr:AAA family ATPase [Treponema sp.]